MSNEELVKHIQNGINVSENIEQLYLQNKGMIYTIIKRYRYACQSDYNSLPIIEMDELMHEAYFGLIKAIESYKVNQGILFMSYASFWIRQVVKRYLDNCGKVVRVSVHTQQRIFKYNSITATFLQNFNRMPSILEYANSLGEKPAGVEQLQRFMFQNKVLSLDSVFTEGENDSFNLIDTLYSDENIEDEVVERVSNKQLESNVWNLLSQILKDDRKVQILRLRYLENVPLREIGKRFNISCSAVDQMVRYSLMLIKRNAEVRRIAVELGIWDGSKPFSSDRIKFWCKNGNYTALDEKELQYAMKMGWVDDERLKNHF